uniref:Uncharacterized protein n=1 Tax=Oryza barthii TaxID=65489 RepID=A0A0D3GIH7_9ORYZ
MAIDWQRGAGAVAVRRRFSLVVAAERVGVQFLGETNFGRKLCLRAGNNDACGAVFSSWGVAAFLGSPNYFLHVKTLSWPSGTGDSGTFGVIPFLKVSSRRPSVSLVQWVLL